MAHSHFVPAALLVLRPLEIVPHRPQTRAVVNFFRALPRHLAVLAGKAWRRWQEGALTPFVLGRLRVLGELPELVRYRRRLRGLCGDVGAWGVEGRYWG